MPFLAVPAFMLVALVAGRVGVYSFFMAVPIAVSLGSAGALVDAILFRLLLRKTVGKKAMWLLYRTNTLVVIALAIGGVMALMLVHPPQIIATVDLLR